MQGADLLRDPDFVQTLRRSPFKPQDLPQLSTAVADTFQNLTPDQRSQMKEVLDELDDMSAEELRSLLRLIEFVEKDPKSYPKFVQQVTATGEVQPDDLPPQYDPRFMAVIKTLVGEAFRKVSATEPKGFAKGGIVSLKQAAQRVQSAGSPGDTLLAHITPFEANVLKSIGGRGTPNPRTGLPEFSWWKSVRKVLKIGAQILGTMALTAIGVPPVVAGAIVGGVSSLLSGGNAKDALKSALIGGVTAGIGSGVSSVFSGGDFFSGVAEGFSSSPSSVSIGDRFSNFFGGGSGAAAEAGAGAAAEAGAGAVEPSIAEALSKAPAYDAAVQGRAAAEAAGQIVSPTVSVPAADVVASYANPAEIDSAIANRFADAPAYDVATQGEAAATAAREAAAPSGISSLMSSEGLKNLWSNYKVPIVLGGGAALIAMDRASKEKVEPSLINPERTGTDLLREYPGVYGFDLDKFTRNRNVSPTITQPVSTVLPGGQYVGMPDTTSPSTVPDFSGVRYPTISPDYFRYAKAGGHISGPGTGTSDSIPARLSDGEFVMTAKAVRGAGDGDRMKGARKMYELMNRFERMA